MEKANDSRALGTFIASMFIFGTIGVLRRYIPLSSALLCFTRGILGGLFLLIFVRIKKIDAGKKPDLNILIRLIITGVMIGINWILLFEAYNHTTVAIATLCYYMEPTMIILLSPLIFKERLTGKRMLCAAVSIAGMVLVSGVLGESPEGGSIKGVILGLGAALFYSAVVIMNKKTPGVEQYRRTTVLLLSAGLVMLPYLMIKKEASATHITPLALILLLIMGILHTGIAYAMYFGSMDGLKMQTVAVLSYIDPVSALFFSALLLKEPLGIPGIIGAVMIIGSAMILHLVL